MLSESDSGTDTEDLDKLTINEHYAKAFEYKKEREELSKLKEKYGSDYGEDDEETDSEDAESEDEDGEELTPAVDAAILRTLARIKRRDPKIYDTTISVFDEEQDRTERQVTDKVKRRVKDKSKPITIRQVALESVLHAGSRSPSPVALPHVEEQKLLRNETRQVFHGAFKADDDELLVPRERTRDEIEQEEEEYRTFLEREVGEDLGKLVVVAGDEHESEMDIPITKSDTGDVQIQESGPEKKKKKDKKSKPKEHERKGKEKEKSKQEEDHEFLMNYILNRGWIDRTSRRVPTYKEITNTKSKTKSKTAAKRASDENSHSHSGSDSGSDNDARNGHSQDDAVAVEDDADFDEIAERFETSYNFRFEEPDAATIKGFPRVLPSTVRREDTTRKDARARRKERKDAELEKTREEVRRLKALKMREVRRRLERIGREGGVADAGLAELDLEGDWDPAAHDAQMAGLYEGGDGSDADGEKPTWEDDIDIGEIALAGMESDEDRAASSTKRSKKDKKKEKKKKKRKGAEDDDDLGVDVDAMDADVDVDVGAGDGEEEWDGTEEMRKRKVEQYMDEVYGLDFNDVVAGLPTRFKYTTTAPQTFALTPAEILMATDQELTQYMSVKRYAPYRAEKWDRDRGERLKEFRNQIRDRVGHSDRPRVGAGAGAGGEEKPKKRIGKKERQRLKAVAEADGTAPAGKDKDGAVAQGKSVSSKGVKRKMDIVDETHDANDNEIHTDQGDGGPKKKRKRRHKKAAQA
ncbi:KRI1-like family C-terminal-domain-containing protein [Hygrophoropsis aurantiaca]|uniref:KRI1-like family C-terminal-domain-containing protein n=1 Tax=Hygrophoropsis aurantiaca TaxID=72124 RepID=A0ACB8A2C9_9AGAM|nr:KRI1-like family C-terminal-domain-containing protein [Hygrophoropsis aurantiaca]